MMNADPGQDWSDEDLARLATRDPEGARGRQAAEMLFGRYTRTVYRWCYRLVPDRERARDLTQDILLSAYRHLGRFEGWGRFSAWLFVICRNRCLDALRGTAPLLDEETTPEMLADERSGPDRKLEEKEDEERLLILVRDHLSPQEQEALWLRCYEKLPVEAITRILTIQQTTGARTVLQSARRKLRAALEGRADD